MELDNNEQSTDSYKIKQILKIAMPSLLQSIAC
jgi:hypothetical protein